ncbi:hypothetical protein BGY98DRAFT_1092283 [Russula aff. rugulosa BPL654]|nr:hypothetical protein BGY98DRAFT_1092283 [Russula aff. rugulosa BPL654]
MRLIALRLVPVALAVSAFAHPSIEFERGLGIKARDDSDSNPQTSLTLDPRVISTGFEQDGSANGTAGQAPSLTSSNNFINFCLTVNFPLTNGQQVKGGSCNTAPMGVIAPSTNMPSAKFVNPSNLDIIKANTTFDIVMALRHLQAGEFTNPDSTYYSAPQQLNSANDVIGHTHFVIEELSSLRSTTPSDPLKFTFFKGVNTAADSEGNVSVTVDGGLPAGVYKLSSINTSANHVPILVAVAQHGALDDQVYFIVTADGKGKPTENNFSKQH